MLVFSVCVNAQEFAKPSHEGVIDYPIAIFPVTSEVTESTQSLEGSQASTKLATDLAENAVGLWQDINNEEAYYSFKRIEHQVLRQPTSDRRRLNPAKRRQKICF